MSYRVITESTTVVYDCKHTRVYRRGLAPKIGESVICIRCNSARIVEFIGLDYKVKCSNCTWARVTGPARLTAECQASKHHSKRPDHEVIMYRGPEEIRRWKPQAETIFAKSLLGKTVVDLDLPPF